RVPPPSRSHPFPTRRSSDLVGCFAIFVNFGGNLNATSQVQKEGFTAKRSLQALCLLRGQGLQPRQTVRTSNGDDAVVREINYCLDRKSTRLNSSHVSISYAV